jgi:hypothetical protein
MKQCYTVKEDRNILPTIKRRKANWIGHILCMNCLLKHVIEVKIEGKAEETGRWGRICKQSVDHLKGKEKTLESEREHTHLENSLWKRLWTCCKTDYMVK